MNRRYAVPLFAMAIALILPALASACPNCYGAADSPQTAGLNNAILSLLGFVGLVLGAIVSFGAYYVRRARQLMRAQSAERPH